MYYTYMIRCEDNSIYTGITTDLERRLQEHKSKSKKCAKYTSKHTAVKLETAWISRNRIASSRLEYNIKKLTKAKKEQLINNYKLLEEFFLDKIDCSEYRNINEKQSKKYYEIVKITKELEIEINETIEQKLQEKDEIKKLEQDIDEIIRQADKILIKRDKDFILKNIKIYINKKLIINI